ncbi:MAG: tRNA pseudouridine(38-40) synthase TruA [Pikeienuella sp.]|uniref:tRNA pseudouridine(38-40) synthase TruA n=1 Tax=Pikeienuella sp. TaxID=2831957 RepID=UPI00391964E4
MPRYRLTLEYDGAPFSGWQRQADRPSVQQALEEAVLRLTGDAAHVQGAGRTDAGVHALGQVAHLDLERDWEPFRLMEALNHHLRPAPVSVIAAEAAGAAFHARFDAVEREYLYRILNRRAPPALDRGRVWHLRQPLDAEAMHSAAQALVGRHDFTTFRAALCQAKSPVKTVDEVRVSRAGEEIHIVARARSFLHNQVRSFVGTLERVGAGAWAPRDVAAALEARDRAACGPVAPPQGLYLVAVRYPGSQRPSEHSP